MEIATIGFTKTTAESFFGRLRECGLPVLVDVRVHNSSQLAGFAKRDDLAFFLRQLCGMRYHPEPLLATDEETMHAYRHHQLTWEEFAQRYEASLREREAATGLDRGLFAKGAVLLCSEHDAAHCHRRLAAEYLAKTWGGVTITHL